MTLFTSLMLTPALLVSSFALQGSAQERVLGMQGSNQSTSQELGPFDPAKAFSYHPRPFANLNAAQVQKLAASTGLPLFQYHVTAARDGKPYTGFMVGRSPLLRGKIPVAVPTMVIPIKFEFLDANNSVKFTFDPNAPDPCAGGNTDTKLVTNSPILNRANFTMNGVNVGNVQYVDGFQRANFWTLINGANYHTTLTPTLHPTVTIKVPITSWATGTGSCSMGMEGGVEINYWDALVQNRLLRQVGATPNALPLFFTGSVLFYDTAPLTGCCILGYHNVTAANPPQTYSVSEFETAGYLGPPFNDTYIMAHEVGEWMDDPLTVNPTPPWGNIGQVGGCPNNLEVGDPLTGTSALSVFLNGFTYHLQELAFFSWFYGGTSLGTGGKYSNNGTFGGFAKLCPPGGTN